MVIPLKRMPDCEANVTPFSSNIADIVAGAMTPADLEEYANCTWLDQHNELVSSVNWTEYTKNVDLSAVSMSPAPASTRSCDVSDDTSPFLLDTSCTIYILLE